MMRPVPQRTVRYILLYLLVSAVLLSQTSSWAAVVADQAKVPGGGTVVCQPEHVRFHQVMVGQNSSLTVTMLNSGSASVTVNQVTVNHPEFQVENLRVPFTLGVGKSIQFEVVFTPSDTEHLTDQITFTHDGTNSPYALNVHGTGVPPGALTPNPSVVRFGNVQVGDNRTQYVTLTNNGTSTVTISRAPVDGPGFSIAGLDLPARLTAGHSITFSAIFAPDADGQAIGHVAIHSDAPNSSFKIGLNGLGTRAGQLTASPASLDFGAVSVGSNKTLGAELAATGADVTVSSAILNNPEFALQGISFPVTIPAGQKVKYSVKFQPADQGKSSAKLMFVSNAANSPTSEQLLGVGAGVADHSVGLTWKRSKSPDVVGYNIYRSNHRHGTYGQINANLDPTTNYTDTNVTGGLTYFYVTTAVDSGGNESVYSKAVKAVIPYP